MITRMISETQTTQSLEPIEQYRPRLEVFEAIYFRASRPQALFKELAKRLPSVVKLEFIGLILHDPNRDVMRLHILEIDQTERIPEGLELPMEESASAWVMRTQQRLEMPCVLKLLRVLQEQEF
jgi:formate hydrogenlyase transcriptional activator